LCRAFCKAASILSKRHRMDRPARIVAGEGKDMTRDNVARFDETCEQHVSILRLFHEAGGKYSKDPQLYDILEIRDTNLVRLFEIFAAAIRARGNK